MFPISDLLSQSFPLTLLVICLPTIIVNMDVTDSVNLMSVLEIQINSLSILSKRNDMFGTLKSDKTDR